MKRTVNLSTTIALLIGLAVSAGAADVWTSPEMARAEDPDFSIQGEYGFAKENPDIPFGVQLVALADGKFDAYVLEGGLPGAGWDKSKQRTKVSIPATGDATAYRVVPGNGNLKLFRGDKEIATLPRIERESPTLGAKPPEGAVVLFDGSSVDEWEKGRLSEEKLLLAGTTSKKLFKDHVIHIEFRLPYQPRSRGQGRGNSGIYVQGRHEVQMLDSFGLEGKMNEAGGIYSIKHPDLNMCFPPLRWQTYDIDYTAAKYKDGNKVENARMTVRHNGVIVQDNVECDHATTASPLREGDSPGPIYLQHHGNPVVYRNIWVLEK